MSYSTADGPENWGAVRLEGDDDLTLASGAYVRNRGMGIEGGPNVSASGGIGNTSAINNRGPKRTSAMSWSSSKNGTSGRTQEMPSSTVVASDSVALIKDVQDKQLLMTLALLQTFHAHTTFHLSVLESLLPEDWNSETVLQLGPKEVLAFELGPLSGNDARYLEWLAFEYANGMQLVVKRGWRDMLNILFGYS